MSAEPRWSIIDGLPIFYRLWEHAADDAPRVVLVHGAAVSSRNMSPTGDALAPRCRVWAPDLPGHGNSGNPPEVLDAPRLADALARWMDVEGVGPASLLGNSFGCQIIVHFAVRHPGLIERAVLQGPTVDAGARGWPRQFARWLLNSVREGATQPTVTFRDWYDAGLRGFFLTLSYMNRDRIELRLPHVRVSTLVVRGGRDPIVPRRWAEEVVELLPDGRLEVVEGETHTLVFAAPHKLAEVALPFICEDCHADAP